jgi:hypothetical protein
LAAERRLAVRDLCGDQGPRQAREMTLGIDRYFEESEPVRQLALRAEALRLQAETCHRRLDAVSHTQQLL